MSNLFDELDKLDLSSILVEEESSLDSKKFCKSCFNEFTGEGDLCEFCSHLTEEISEEDKLTLEVVKVYEDYLPIVGYTDVTDPTAEEQNDYLTDALNSVYGEGRWSDKEFNDAVRELGLFAIIRESVEEDIEDLQSAASELKHGIEGLEKTEEVSDDKTFEFRGKEYTKEKAQKEIDKIEKDLSKLNKDKVEDLDNAFDETHLDDTNLDEGCSKETDEDSEVKETEEITETEEVSFEEIIRDMENAESYEELYNAADKIKNDNLRADVIDCIQTCEKDGDDVDVAYSIVTSDKLDMRVNDLNEAIQTVTTVDNIDQESKDEATIKKAIELAGSKDKIDNDTFRALRLALANKDYEMIDRLKDYALVRGEDVIYTWLRAEDDDLKESEVNSRLFLREGIDCGTCKEEVLKEPEEDKVIEDNKDKVEEEALQVDDVPAKDDQGKPGKRLELAKLENDGVTTYRVSYLVEDDEIMGWDIDADSDEEAIDTFDKFDSSSDTIDDLSNIEFNDTPIDGISSTSYEGVDLALSTAEDGNALLTITTQEGIPVLLKGENLDDILTKLIYWFIMGAGSTGKEVI